MQEVNLLSDDLRPQHDPFTLREFAIAWAVLVVLLALLTGWQLYSNMVINNDTTAAKAELATLTTEVASLQATTLKQADSVLVQQLSAASTQREEQQRLLQVLTGEPLNSGFAGHLEDLASIDIRKLWFDSILLAKGSKQVRLSGFSETAELVPLYLSMLAEGSAFSGYNFDELQIKRESDVLVSFVVSGPQERLTDEQ